MILSFTLNTKFGKACPLSRYAFNKHRVRSFPFSVVHKPKFKVTYAFSPAMVREAVQLGADVLNGKTLEKEYIIKTVEVDRNNVNDFRNSDIYKIRYSIQ